MTNAMNSDFGNASALHSSGVQAKNLVEEARKSVARLIGAEPSEIIFTSGGSEANNTIINTFRDKNIITSAIEHPSVLEPAKAYAKSLSLIPVDKTGLINLKTLKTTIKNIKEETLCSVMLANNELGTIEPITEIKSIISALEIPEKILLHTDATQALGKIKINVKELGVDYLSASAHKIGGPIGIGFLYIKTGSPLKPLILGGHQEKGRRAGTTPVVQIAGLKSAVDYAIKKRTWETYNQRVRKLRNELATKILKNVPYSSLNTNLENSLPNILNVSFRSAEGESIQLYLDLKKNIAVSTGSACASGDGSPSHVIMATRNDAEIAHSSIRFSLTLKTTEKDIEAVLKVLPGIVKNLQGISTLNPKEKK